MKLAPRQCPICMKWVDYFKDDCVYFNAKHYHKKCHDRLQKEIEKRKKSKAP